jgi:hypothetical protein
MAGARRMEPLVLIQCIAQDAAWGIPPELEALRGGNRKAREGGPAII